MQSCIEYGNEILYMYLNLRFFLEQQVIVHFSYPLRRLLILIMDSPLHLMMAFGIMLRDVMYSDNFKAIVC